MSRPIAPQAFYERDTVKVAKDLLGMYLVRELNGNTSIGRIVETEAYVGDDPACHAFANHQRAKLGHLPKGRSAILFGEPGLSYVYLNYGVYYLFNIVTEKIGVPGAVLIRALEPVLGVEAMQSRRPKAKNLIDTSNGPGKLALAMGIGPQLNAHPVFTPKELYVTFGEAKVLARDIISTTRVGLSKAKDVPWRFYLKGNAFISKL